MTQLEKLYQRVKNNPKTVRFEELDRVLIRAGFTRSQPGGGSSHYVYRKGDKKLVVPHRRPFIKEIYVKRAVELLEGPTTEKEEPIE